jgi:hypothetical protein
VLRDKEGMATARKLHAEVNRLYNGAKALDAMNASRNPLDTEARHMKKVADAARKFDREVTAAINRAGEITREGTADAQRRIDEKINLKPDADAKEIREVFRAMKREDKLAYLSNLIDEKNGPELAAIIRAKPSLTGLTAAEHADFEAAVTSRHASAELEEQEKLQEAFNDAIMAFTTAGKFAGKLNDPLKIAEIERREAAAIEAGADFDQSLASE